MSKPNLVAITTLVADRGEGLPDEFLVDERPVGLGMSKKVTPRSTARTASELGTRALSCSWCMWGS